MDDGSTSERLEGNDYVIARIDLQCGFIHGCLCVERRHCTEYSGAPQANSRVLGYDRSFATI